jgi:1-acyl-sn-glycerol-3-phosphate acyltransferase
MSTAADPSTSRGSPPRRSADEHGRRQWLIARATELFFRSFYGLRAVNRPEIDGPHILAPNHASYLDPMVLQAVYARPITFLMDSVIYAHPFLSWLFKLWGAIPVSTSGGSSVGAMKEALRAVHQGGVVGIFPEGRISLDGSLQAGQAGISLLIQRAAVPVIPVAILGAYESLPKRADFPRPGRILVAFGDPILPPPAGADRKISAADFRDRVMAAIAETIERYRHLR